MTWVHNASYVRNFPVYVCITQSNSRQHSPTKCTDSPTSMTLGLISSLPKPSSICFIHPYLICDNINRRQITTNAVVDKLPYPSSTLKMRRPLYLNGAQIPKHNVHVQSFVTVGTQKRKWCGLHQSVYSLSGRTSHRNISRSLEAVRLDVTTIVSFWNLTGISAALLPKVPVKLESDWINLNTNLAASRLHEILRQYVCPLSA